MAVVSLKNVALTFGGPILLQDANLQIERGEKVGLLGRNGVGKSTLLRLIHGDIKPDNGEVSRQQQLRSAHLLQEVPKNLTGSVRDIIAAGLDSHHFTDDVDEEDWQREIQVDQVISKFKLNGDIRFELLSAGMKRRVLLAKGLVRNPELLLLDEPTNHLDIDAIEWLEQFLKRWGGTLIFVTHDRMFLDHMSSRIVELDRGELFDWNCDYKTFRKRKEAMVDAQEVRNEEFDKKLAQEEKWIRRGLEARRTRNMGRVRSLERLRRIRQERREQPGKVRLQIEKARRSGELVVEAKGVCFSYEKQKIISNFSTTIMRGDRVGFVGPNGSGKTTLLRLLIGELNPWSGNIRLGTNIEIAYFDQLRAQLDESKSIIDNVGQGRDFVTINGRPRNLIGYLGDFLFSKELINAPITSLSGGERNRLMLARLFAQPSNLLILDEPTNDLDIETLEILENMLLTFEGTLLLVSHDRAFLNNLVTSTIILDGSGNTAEYIGGFDDWMKEKKGSISKAIDVNIKKTKSNVIKRKNDNRLTFQERKELESLPEQIEGFDVELSGIMTEMGNPAFYHRSPEAVKTDTDRYHQLEELLEKAYLRWDELGQKDT